MAERLMPLLLLGVVLIGAAIFSALNGARGIRPKKTRL